MAFANEYDFDSPDVRYNPLTSFAPLLINSMQAIDFDVLVQVLRDLKAGYVIKLSWKPHSPILTSCRKRAEIPVYSFAKHQRLDHTTSIYSPHVLILEGIFALYDPRVLELLDMGVCTVTTIPPQVKLLNIISDLLRSRWRYLPCS